MTPETENKVLIAMNVFMALFIVGFVANFVWEAHKMFTKGDNVGGWMAIGVAAVFVGIGILGALSMDDN